MNTVYVFNGFESSGEHMTRHGPPPIFSQDFTRLEFSPFALTVREWLLRFYTNYDSSLRDVSTQERRFRLDTSGGAQVTSNRCLEVLERSAEKCQEESNNKHTCDMKKENKAGYCESAERLKCIIKLLKALMIRLVHLETARADQRAVCTEKGHMLQDHNVSDITEGPYSVEYVNDVAKLENHRESSSLRASQIHDLTLIYY